MVLKYVVSRKGIVFDAIAFYQYHEMGDPNDPGYPSGWNGMPGIVIEREHGEDIHLLYHSSKDRNKEYELLLEQVEQQTKNNKEEM